MYVYHLQAEKLGLHPNLACVLGDRGCGNTIPGDVPETRVFALSVPKAKSSLKGSPRATHCTDSAQTFGNVTPTVELCPPHLTFPIKVRARRDVSEEQKNDNYTYTYLQGHSHTTVHRSRVEATATNSTADHWTPVAVANTDMALLCFYWHCVPSPL